MVVTMVITDTDVVSAKVDQPGDLVEVRAPGTPGGYTWRLTGLSNGIALVRTGVGEDPHAALPAGVSRPVGGVRDTLFVFAAAMVGTATATLVLVRPWLPETPLREVVVTVETAAGAVRTPTPAPLPFGGAKPGPFRGSSQVRK